MAEKTTELWFEEISKALKKPISEYSIGLIKNAFDQTKNTVKSSELETLVKNGLFFRIFCNNNIVNTDGKYTLDVSEDWYRSENIESVFLSLYTPEYRNNQSKIVACVALLLATFSKDCDLITRIIRRCFSTVVLRFSRLDFPSCGFKDLNSYKQDIVSNIISIVESAIALVTISREIKHGDPKIAIRNMDRVVRIRSELIKKHFNTNEDAVNNVLSGVLLENYIFSKEMLDKIDAGLKEIRIEFIRKKEKSISDNLFMIPPQSNNIKVISDNKNYNPQLRTYSAFDHQMLSDVFPILYNDIDSGVEYFIDELTRMANNAYRCRYGGHRHSADLYNAMVAETVKNTYANLESVIDILGEDKSILMEKLSRPECAVLYQYLL